MSRHSREENRDGQLYRHYEAIALRRLRRRNGRRLLRFASVGQITNCFIARMLSTQQSVQNGQILCWLFNFRKTVNVQEFDDTSRSAKSPLRAGGLEPSCLSLPSCAPLLALDSPAFAPPRNAPQRQAQQRAARADAPAIAVVQSVAAPPRPATRALRAIGPSTIEPEVTNFRTARPGGETNFPSLDKLLVLQTTKRSVL
jgi:hypothetical protein